MKTEEKWAADWTRILGSANISVMKKTCTFSLEIYAEFLCNFMRREFCWGIRNSLAPTQLFLWSYLIPCFTNAAKPTSIFMYVIRFLLLFYWSLLRTVGSKSLVITNAIKNVSIINNVVSYGCVVDVGLRRSLKLSSFGQGQYLVGWPLGRAAAGASMAEQKLVFKTQDFCIGWITLGWLINVNWNDKKNKQRW